MQRFAGSGTGFLKEGFGEENQRLALFCTIFARV
jgi:hypothetical protein